MYGVPQSQLYTETSIAYLPHRTLPYSEGFRVTSMAWKCIKQWYCINKGNHSYISIQVFDKRHKFGKTFHVASVWFRSKINSAFVRGALIEAKPSEKLSLMRLNCHWIHNKKLEENLISNLRHKILSSEAINYKTPQVNNIKIILCCVWHKMFIYFQYLHKWKNMKAMSFNVSVG